jgi:hypothetical protein
MHAFTFLTTLLLTLSPALISAAALPGPLAKRDHCDTLTTFSESDTRALQESLQSSSADLTFLGAHSYHSWDHGSARICVWNDYIFENTHVSQWEAGWAVGYVFDMCCSGQGGDW